MRLPDIVNQFRRKLSEGRNFVQNPSQTVFRGARKQALNAYEQAAVPGTGEKKTRSAESSNRQGWPERPEWSTPRVPRGALSTGSRTAITPALTTATAVIQVSSHLDYPAPLVPGDILIRGWVGRYVVGPLLRDRGWMRLYDGVQENSNEAVWIYEYSFSEAVFSDREAQSRRLAFKQIIDLNSRLGEGSDFRILNIRDVIAPPKGPCYLMTQALPGGQCLAESAPLTMPSWSPGQMRELLRQVLQSLQYLQAYQVHWPEGQAQRGLPHGRLGPESLWLRFSEAKLPIYEPAFFIYLSRLALWEHLFDPALQGVATATPDLGSLAQDFKALGTLAFELLDGDPQIDPALLDAWPEDAQARSLYPFICRLLDTGPEEPFRSPEAAIAALRQLPLAVLPAENAPIAVGPADQTPTATSDSPRIWLWLLAGLLLVGAIPLVRWLVQGEAPLELAGPTCEAADDCTLTLGTLEPTASIVYAVEPGTSWDRSFFRSLGSPLTTTGTVLLDDALRQRLGVGANALQKAVLKPRDRQDLLTQLERGHVQAALIRGGDEGLPPGIAETTVAYDGIAIFVTSSDARRDRNLPKLVNGQISLADLRQLFTQERPTLGKGQHPVKLYFPQGYTYSEKDAETVALFRELLFNQDEDRTKFDQVQQKTRRAIAVLPQTHGSIYAHMLSDFETQSAEETVIGIGFDRISRLHGQCSVYPLALTHQGKTYPILVGVDGKPLDIDFDLCGDKGAYWVNSDSFTRASSYPLGFGLTVAYPEACATVEAECQPPGAILAAKLRSIEGQYLLSETGLVPVEPIQRIRRFLWRGTYAR